ncbi:hypothetical protein LTR56_021658 [Elasticomyces elasticus]|nr:hypothetical protein LTR56_021658 [Elasticomyces elasticus]KAK3623526.1 hypothetical protein LTR22_024376 [Elasticomyces elasticus]KAK5759041.1 hypothetical protein LTS12_010813 [Elasticomyces elasticus]
MSEELIACGLIVGVPVTAAPCESVDVVEKLPLGVLVVNGAIEKDWLGDGDGESNVLAATESFAVGPPLYDAVEDAPLSCGEFELAGNIDVLLVVPFVGNVVKGSVLTEVEPIVCVPLDILGLPPPTCVAVEDEMLPASESDLDTLRNVVEAPAASSDVVEREVSKVERIELPETAEMLDVSPLTLGAADSDLLSERETELGVVRDMPDVTAAFPDVVKREVSKVERIELPVPAERLEVPPAVCDAVSDEMLSEEKSEVGAARDDPEVVSPLLDRVEKEVSNVEEIESPGTAETLALPIGDDVGLDVLRESELEACVLTTMLESPAMPGVVKLLLDDWPDALERKPDELTDFELPTVGETLVPLGEDAVE